MSSERPWVDDALRCLTAGKPTALISVLEVLGSTPREAGTRMVVTVTDSFGTIGGGNLEFRAVDQAHLCLAHPAGTWRIQDYPLGPLMNQCCGGHVRVMIERLGSDDAGWLRALQTGDEVRVATELTEARPVRTVVSAGAPLPSAKMPVPPPRERGGRREVPAIGDHLTETFERARDQLLLFGAGHVGQALVHVLKGLPFRLNWCDNREDYRGLEGLELLDEAGLIDQARGASGQVLIMTHDHALDYRLTVAALASQATFIGLIGSQTKRARFLSRLKADGFTASDIARVTCPIGLEGLGGKAPEIIAISVAAQLLFNLQSAVATLSKPQTLLGCAC